MAENQLAQTKAQLAQANAQLVNAKNNLSYTSVTLSLIHIYRIVVLILEEVIRIEMVGYRPRHAFCRGCLLYTSLT